MTKRSGINITVRTHLTPKGNLKARRVVALESFTGEEQAAAVARVKERRAFAEAYNRESIKKTMAQKAMFQLYRGETPFGAPKEMTYGERKRLNKKFEMKFLNDKNPNARLWAWQVLTWKPSPKGTTVAEAKSFIRGARIARAGRHKKLTE